MENTYYKMQQNVDSKIQKQYEFKSLQFNFIVEPYEASSVNQTHTTHTPRAINMLGCLPPCCCLTVLMTWTLISKNTVEEYFEKQDKL